MSSKRVAIVAPPTRPVPPVRGGGAQLVIYETTKRLAKYDSLIYSVADSKLPEKHVIEGVSFFHIDLEPESRFHRFYIDRLMKRYRYYAYRIAAELNQLRPELVHIHSSPWVLASLVGKLKYKPKIILQHHNCPISRSFKSWEVNSLMAKVDAFIGVSDYVVMEELINKYPNYESKCRVVYNGVDTDFFSPASNRSELRKQFGIDKEIVILFSGQIKYSKGILTVLNAFKKLQIDYSNLKLFIVGSPSGADDKPSSEQQDFFKLFLDMIDALGDNARHFGFVDHNKLKSIYQVCDIFCAPSIMTEPFGLVIAEAMATGLPVVTSARGGIPEVIGDTGFLVEDPESADQVAYYLEKLIVDTQLRNQLGSKARQRVVDLFTWDRAALETENIYDELLSQGSERKGLI